MSRPRTYTYAGHPQPAPTYYYDDLEGYVGDYSESDGVSDATPHHVMPGLPTDVTELYRRKTVTAMTNNQDHYSNGYLQGPPPPPPEYYYEAMGPQQQMMAPAPLPRTAVYRKRMPVIAERPPGYYSSDRPDMYDSVNFRSTHQLITSLPRTAVPASIPSATAVRPQAVRRHPITVRTPKYYRRSSGPALVKRPSALCLPVSCQPDPAVYKRTKRIPPEQIYQPPPPLPPGYVYQQTPLSSQPTSQFSGDNNVRTSAQQIPPAEYSGRQDNELNVTKSKLDAALERYEQIFEKNVVEFTGATPDVKLVRLLKPKIPSTIKEKEENRRNINNSDWTNVCGSNGEGFPTDTLEEMLLADLQANGFANDESGDFKLPAPKETDKKHQDKSPRSTEGTMGSDKALKDLPKSFNYDEIQTIQNNVAKTALAHHNLCERPKISDEHFQTPEHDVPKMEMPPEPIPIKDESRSNFTSENGKSDYSRPMTIPSNNGIAQMKSSDVCNQKSSDSVKSMRAATVPRVLVDDALELHRTKSYVVNLIDHALSNHFGTNLCEKYSTKENPIDHRVAVEILKKHSAGKMDKELCVEIAQALADTFNSNTSCASAPCRESETKRHHDTGTCSCSKIPEEPLYVKQLKQLRWGHLKHIQREVRRLEDLERFLDSCSSNSFV